MTIAEYNAAEVNATKIAVLLIIGYAIGYWSLYALDFRSADHCTAGFVNMTVATFWYRFCLFIAALMPTTP